MKRLMCGSTWLFSSTQRIVVGSVAALKKELEVNMITRDSMAEYLRFLVSSLTWPVLRPASQFISVLGDYNNLFSRPGDIRFNLQNLGHCGRKW